MKKVVFIEGLLLMVVSLVGMGEGFRLVLYKDPYTLYDPLGPGFYLIAISLGLMALGIVHLFSHPASPLPMEGSSGDKKMRIKVALTVLSCVIYLFLIRIFGYPLATLFFFILEFKIHGIRSWPIIVLLSLIFSAFYYLIFVQYCHMVFPRGILFQ